MKNFESPQRSYNVGSDEIDAYDENRKWDIREELGNIEQALRGWVQEEFKEHGERGKELTTKYTDALTARTPDVLVDLKNLLHTKISYGQEKARGNAERTKVIDTLKVYEDYLDELIAQAAEENNDHV